MSSLKLALGTAQFGLDYGVANQRGKLRHSEVRNILDLARHHDVRVLDTAPAYGDSEKILGRLVVSDFQVISKLPPLPEHITNIDGWVFDTVTTTLNDLKLPNLHALLFHRPLDIASPSGEKLVSAVTRLKEQGLIRSVGLSIYSPTDLEMTTPYLEPDIVQAPLNIFDRRLITSGWLSALANRGIEVHARSVFMQGLLLMAPNKRPRYFDQWSQLLSRYDAWLQERQISAVEASIGYINGLQDINQIVVGVDSAAHLQQITTALTVGPVDPPISLAIEDEQLVNPSRWNL